jgi:hypothetical protein
MFTPGPGIAQGFIFVAAPDRLVCDIHNLKRTPALMKREKVGETFPKTGVQKFDVHPRPFHQVSEHPKFTSRRGECQNVFFAVHIPTISPLPRMSKKKVKIIVDKTRVT